LTQFPDNTTPLSYSDVSESVLGGGSSAPTLISSVNPTVAVDYIDGGTFVVEGASSEFYAIISIDENDFGAVGNRVGNGKTTTWFWAQVCYELSSTTVYKTASATCSSSIYCVEGPADSTDK
jgi:hypothetical protein